MLLSSSVCADEPQRLTALRESYERELQASKQKYVESLKKLKSVYTKGGDKKAVVAILKEIDKITGKTSAEKTPFSGKDITFTAWLSMVSFRDRNGVIYTVKDEKHIEIDASSGGGRVFVIPLTEINDKRRTFVVAFDENMVRKYRVKSTLKSAEVIESEKGKTKEELIVIPGKKFKSVGYGRP